MEPGHRELYDCIRNLHEELQQVRQERMAQDACLRLQDQDIADMRKRIVALESLGGATPAEVALATTEDRGR